MLAEAVPAALPGVSIEVECNLVRLALRHVAIEAGRAPCSHAGGCSCRLISDQCRPGPIDVLVVRDEPVDCQHAVDAVTSGTARSIVLWDEPESLPVALAAVDRGSVVLPRRVLDLAARAPSLTDRQRRTLRLLTAGRSNSEIAAAMNVSLSTAKREIGELLGLFDVPNRAALTSTASVLGFGARRVGAP